MCALCVCVSFCSGDASTEEGAPKQQLLFVLLSTLQLFRCGSGERTPLGASLTAGNRESVASRCLCCHAIARPGWSCRCVSCGSISLLTCVVKRLFLFPLDDFLVVSAMKYRC